MSNRAERIEAALRQQFSPSVLAVRDDSHRHAGHAGARPEGETHYAVLMVAAAFAGQPRVARARTVHAVLEAELSSGLHALALTLRAPDEHAAIVESATI